MRPRRATDTALDASVEVAAAAPIGSGAAIGRILEMAREELHLDVAFFAELTEDAMIFRGLDGDAKSFGWELGQAVPLEHTFCKRMVSEEIPNVIPDARANERTRDLGSTRAADIGSYIGVPVRLSDGTLYGSLCCLGHEANDQFLPERDARLMRLLARMIADQLDQELDAAKRLTARDATDEPVAASESEELEARRRQSERLESVGRLAGGVAHDFNNLLAVILNYADFVAEQLPEGGAIRQDVEQIREAGERAAALTRQLLVFSRREVVAPTVLDVNLVITELERLLERTLGEQVRLLVDLAPGLRRVMADAGQVEQVLVNLAVNARDAMPDGGRLIVATADVELDPVAAGRRELMPGPHVRIAVSDTGSGIDPATAARIFEPFFTTKPTGEGTGLGLATVHGIVMQAGGHIEVRSEDGAGTTFEIHLPATERTVDAVEVTEPASPAGGNETVLVVEDDGGVLDLTCRILSESGYRAVAAASAAEALALWERRAHEFDLVLTDVVMPEMGGKELAERLSVRAPDLPVLFMSGYSDDAGGARADSSVRDRLMAKPFTSADLLRHVGGAVHAQPQQTDAA